MKALIGRTVFAIGETDYCWEDVILAGGVRGEWPSIVRRARAGLALLAAADEDEGEELSVPSEDEIDEAANEFRYAQNLIAADEMEAWLTAWGLDVGAFMEWVVMDLLRARNDADDTAAEALADTPVDDEALATAIHAEAVCSGALGKLSYRLAEWASVHAREAELGGAPEAADGGEAPALPPGSELPPLGLEGEELASRLRRLHAYRGAYERFTAEVVTPELVAGRVRARQTEWTRVSARILRFPAEDAAREALTSIRDDGAEIDEVAADAGIGVVEGTFFLEEFDAGVRDRLLASVGGDLLGPLREGESWSLFLVVDKKLPSADDAGIAERAATSLLRSALTREVDNRVSWRWQA